MKLLLIGDIHLSDRAPSACTDDYLNDLITILEHTVSLESSLNVDGVVWSGDVFHVKQANRNSHSLVQRAIDIVQAYKNLWIVPGNHDLAYDRFDSIESQPLGVLFKAGAKLLNGWADPDGMQLPLYGVPWQQEWTDEALTEALTAWNGLPLGQQEKRKDALVVAHAPLYRPGTEPSWENYPTEGWAEIQGVGACFYGHVHERHGIYPVGNVTFCNHGAITRGSLHESELSRAVVVTTWSAEEGFTEVPIPHKPASEVFRLMQHHERQDAKLELESFLERAGQATLEVASIEAILAHIRTLDVTPDVVKLAEELLAQASG